MQGCKTLWRRTIQWSPAFSLCPSANALILNRGFFMSGCGSFWTNQTLKRWWHPAL